LLESCGVHIISLTTQLILLVERRYPLSRFTLDQMLNAVRLGVEKESEMSLELLRFTRQRVKDPESKDPLGERLARCTAPAALPSLPLPPPLHMLPPVDCRDDIPKTEMPPCKRLCLSTLGSREVRYSIRDTWVDPTETVPEIAPMTVGEVKTRVTELAELHEHDTQDLYALLEDAHDNPESKDPLGERLARCTAPAALPSLPLPPPLHMPPPVDCRDDIPETEMPPCKRLCLSTLGSREVRYSIRDTWVDPIETVPEIAPMTVGERVDLLMEDMIAHQKTIQIMEDEAYAAREACAHSIGLSQAASGTDGKDSLSDGRHETRDGRHAGRAASTPRWKRDPRKLWCCSGLIERNIFSLEEISPPKDVETSVESSILVSPSSSVGSSSPVRSIKPPLDNLSDESVYAKLDNLL
nr:hypothetical protein [Tanacetum cinerariifolium]